MSEKEQLGGLYLGEKGAEKGMRRRGWWEGRGYEEGGYMKKH